jgi:hypothetical protein
MYKRVKVNPKQAEVAGHWFKALGGDPISKDWCVARSIGLTKASAEVPDSAGGFLVPELVASEILRIVDQIGAFRRGTGAYCVVPG